MTITPWTPEWYNPAYNNRPQRQKTTTSPEKNERFTLVNKDSNILTQPTKRFDFLAPPFEPVAFAQDLIRFMYDKNGIGLAANQVGVPYSIFAMRGTPENFVCFNPTIVWYSDAIIDLEEGCLTYKNLIMPIIRSQHIRVRFNTPNGDIETRKFTGLTSRIFQHEMMHIQGKVFFHKMISKLKLEIAIKKAKKMGSDYSNSGLMRYAK